MSTEPSPYLDLLDEFVLDLSHALVVSTPVWDRPATRVLLGLYDLPCDANAALALCFENLNKFQSEDHIGWKVHWIHRTGKHLAELLVVLTRFTDWIVAHDTSLSALKVWNSDLAERWNYLDDDAYSFGYGEHTIAHWTEIIALYRSRLQATDSPNPDHFPAQATVDDIAASLHRLDDHFSAGILSCAISPSPISTSLPFSSHCAFAMNLLYVYGQSSAKGS